MNFNFCDCLPFMRMYVISIAATDAYSLCLSPALRRYKLHFYHLLLLSPDDVGLVVPCVFEFSLWLCQDSNVVKAPVV